jgi:hypothetical protein
MTRAILIAITLALSAVPAWAFFYRGGSETTSSPGPRVLVDANGNVVIDANGNAMVSP